MCCALCRHEEVEQKKEKADVIEKVIPHRKHKEAVRKVKKQLEKCEPLKQVAVRVRVCVPVPQSVSRLELVCFDDQAWPLHDWPAF